MKKIIVLLLVLSFANIFAQKSSSIQLNKNASLHWEIQKFDASKHTFEYCLNDELKYLCKIDHKDWFGSDRGLEFPKNELKKLEINIDGKKIKLETSQMFNPNFSGELNEMQFKLKKEQDYFILYSFFLMEQEVTLHIGK